MPNTEPRIGVMEDVGDTYPVCDNPECGAIGWTAKDGDPCEACERRLEEETPDA